jgi:hypothetical protein
MSNVVSGTPRETYTAAELAEERGGYQCGPTRGGGFAATIAAVALALAGRRRAAFLACLVALGAVRDARAAEDDRRWKGGAVEVRFGPLWFDEVGGDDNPVTAVYGDTGNQLLMLEGGPSLFDVLQIELGIGRYHRRGNPVDSGGTSSGEDSAISMYPLTAGGRIRLDVLREQWIVPTVAAGADYWLWTERSAYDSENYEWRDKIGGGKPGWHWAAGAQILLDAFEPRRASQLTARTGIDDSYIVAEYREQEIGEDHDGLIFTGSSFTVGLRVSY